MFYRQNQPAPTPPPPSHLVPRKEIKCYNTMSTGQSPSCDQTVLPKKNLKSTIIQTAQSLTESFVLILTIL